MPNSRTEAAKHSLLPTIIDDLACQEPGSIWGEYPRSEASLKYGYEKISYAQFANAVNGVAHQLESTLGRKDTGEPLAFLGSNDPRCPIALIAAIKAGFKLFLISEGNNLTTNIKLLDDVQCSTLVTTSKLLPPVQSLLAERTMTSVELFPLELLLNNPHSPYPFTKTLDEAERDTAFMTHTSGSAGFPKSMSVSHSYVARVAQNIGLDAPEGYEMLSSMIGNNRSVVLTPLGHPAGVHFGILNPFFNNTTVILPLPTVSPTGEALLDILKNCHADWVVAVPLTLETISKGTALLNDIARHVKLLLFSSGSLSSNSGDTIASKIKLVSLVASPETGPLPTMYRYGYNSQKDWNYVRLHPALGARFDPLPGDVFELVFERSPKCESHQTVFTLYPDLEVYRTKDLFTPHPSLPDTWTHASHSDDIIVFLSGEKANPIVFESYVARNPEVSAALMFGHQRFEAGLLIELNYQDTLTTLEKAHIMQRIWPTIEEANELLPAYTRVSESHVCFTDPGVPFIRTLKGSIHRQATLQQCSDKVNQLYIDVEAIWTPVSRRPNIGAIEKVKELVSMSVREATGWEDIQEKDDFFIRGMDSLQVLHLVRLLRQKVSIRSIQPSTIYLTQTVSALATTLKTMARDMEFAAARKKEQQLRDRIGMLKKHMHEIDLVADNILSQGVRRGYTSAAREDKRHTVLLTGSTGSIGSFILNTLISEPRIRHIYCLNRSANPGTLQKERNALLDSTLPTAFAVEKVTFLTANLSEPLTLGLPAMIYKSISDQVTLVIYNSWNVDSHLPLTAFESPLSGVVNLSALCVHSTLQAAFVLISSISAVSQFDVTKSTNCSVPETIIENIEAPAANGYAESKYISERLLAHATAKLGLRRAVVLRLSQIAGPARSDGRWDFDDWIPAMIMGSKYLGVLPSSLDGDEQDSHTHQAIDWLPIDELADVVVEIGLQAADQSLSLSSSSSSSSSSSNDEHIRVLHPLNPYRTTWKALLPCVKATLEETASLQTTIEVVPPGVWITRLRANAAALLDGSASDETREAILHANPALQLLDFFDARFGAPGGDKAMRGDLQWETVNAEEASAKLRSAAVIDGAMMARWVRQWCG
ncbi:hypothetical protein ASPZODRAFT_892681 [Penicilliopsis zonata CBS 506.65]|uniref:Carrier domain-containing protein n=1 Tax=Penicilliopsis zonata CBS 506.65 TaxID=1073090 RepID=A0A1L9S9U9_9EURO|nr:hypothetical protein ASPZODRAFT_892681 [Penicilliopsis zonata CBS 506.65]OJJ43897.1 hypothetical protein ASPZODRAFT_892681 [Penicilliopsis zonata CBS 506.65]